MAEFSGAQQEDVYRYDDILKRESPTYKAIDYLKLRPTENTDASAWHERTQKLIDRVIQKEASTIGIPPTEDAVTDWMVNQIASNQEYLLKDYRIDELRNLKGWRNPFLLALLSDHTNVIAAAGSDPDKLDRLLKSRLQEIAEYKAADPNANLLIDIILKAENMKEIMFLHGT